MRKKEIWGNFSSEDGVRHTRAIKKISAQPERYSALIHFLPGSKELSVESNGQKTVLAAAGYRWLMYLPMDESWCLTAFFNPKGRLFQWYFDISRRNFIDENGTPSTDDLYLDLVILPDGNSLLLDADELKAALDQGALSPADSLYAYQIRDRILTSQWSDVAFLNSFCARLMQTSTNPQTDYPNRLSKLIVKTNCPNRTVLLTVSREIQNDFRYFHYLRQNQAIRWGQR